MFKRLILISLISFISLSPLSLARADAPSPDIFGLGQLTSLALSPDGKTLAIGTASGVYFYDAMTFNPIGYWPVTGRVNNIVWSPQGGEIVLTLGEAYATYSIEVRSVVTGSTLWTIPRTNWTTAINSIVFSDDGQQIFFARSQLLDVRLTQTGEVIFQEQSPTTYAYRSLATNPYTHSVAVCCRNSKIELRSQVTYEVLSKLPVGNAIFSPFLTWNPQRGLLGQAGSGGWLAIWDVQKRQIITTIEKLERIESAAFSPNGEYFALGTSAGLMRVWSTNNWQEPLFVDRGHEVDVSSMAWSPDSQILYTAGGNTVRAWDINTKQQIRLLDGFTSAIRHVVWSADGQRLIAVQGGQLGDWDLATRLPLAVGPLDLASWPCAQCAPRVNEFVVSPVGNYVATADDRGVTLFDAQSLKQVRRLITDYRVSAVAFSPDGNYVLTGGNSPFVVIWDVRTGTPAKTLLTDPQDFNIKAVAFDTNGSAIYVYGDNKLIYRWDVVAEIPTSLSISLSGYSYWNPVIVPAANRFISQDKKQILVYDLKNGAQVFSLPTSASTGAARIAVNNQGTRLAAVDASQIKIWNLQTGELLAQYNSCAGDLSFSPNGQSLASGSTNGVVCLWPVP